MCTENITFESNYNGNGFTISNLVIKDGLFAYVGGKGVVENAVFDNYMATILKSDNIGIAAAYNNGKIQNCTFKNCTANTNKFHLCG